MDLALPLGGSWVLRSRVVRSMVTPLITKFGVLVTLLWSTHEPPSNHQYFSVRLLD